MYYVLNREWVAGRGSRKGQFRVEVISRHKTQLAALKAANKINATGYCKKGCSTIYVESISDREATARGFLRK